MSIIGLVNGFPLLQMPAAPGPRTVDWSGIDVVGSVPNPFTLKEQIQNWQAAKLEATVTLPPMQRTLAAAWVAFLLQCQGQNAVFYFGDPLSALPQGTAEGVAVTAGSYQQPFTLTTSGWAPGQAGLLMPGDWVQVGYRLYMCMDLASSDSAGNASFAIWPQIREIPANGTPVVTTNAQGLFRLATNVRKWNESYLRTWGLSFPIKEAI